MTPLRVQTHSPPRHEQSKQRWTRRTPAFRVRFHMHPLCRCLLHRRRRRRRAAGWAAAGSPTRAATIPCGGRAAGQRLGATPRPGSGVWGGGVAEIGCADWVPNGFRIGAEWATCRVHWMVEGWWVGGLVGWLGWNSPESLGATRRSHLATGTGSPICALPPDFLLLTVVPHGRPAGATAGVPLAPRWRFSCSSLQGSRLGPGPAAYRREVCRRGCFIRKTLEPVGVVLGARSDSCFIIGGRRGGARARRHYRRRRRGRPLV